METETQPRLIIDKTPASQVIVLFDFIEEMHERSAVD